MSRFFAEIAVIGGGIIGASITYHLARDGADAMLIERCDLASGTSSRCDGCVVMQSKGTGLKLELALECARIYRGLADELGEDIDHEICGAAVVLESARQLGSMRSVVEELKKRGIGVELWSREELMGRLPGLGGSFIGASYHAGDGQVDPLKVTFALGRAARRLGARIKTFCEVKEIALSRGKLKKIVTSSGDLFANKVVNAAGVWAPAIGSMAGMAIPVAPRRGQRFVSEATAPFLPFILLSGSYLGAKLGLDLKAGADARFKELGVGLLAHHTKNGNAIVGSTNESTGPSASTNPVGLYEMAKNAFELLPRLKSSTIIRTFAGLRPTTPDGLPIIGPDERLPWFVTAAGHGGDGVSLAPITGRIVADIIKFGSLPTHLKELSPARFSRAANNGD